MKRAPIAQGTARHATTCAAAALVLLAGLPCTCVAAKSAAQRPSIYFNSPGHRVTGTEIVALGQRITLWCGDAKSKNFPPANWKVPNANVGGYTAKPGGGMAKVLDAKLNGPNPTTFYWTSTGTKTVSCAIDKGANTTAATFDVQGPKNAQVRTNTKAPQGHVWVYHNARPGGTNCPALAGWHLAFGNICTDQQRGITFTASADDLKLQPGKFVWVQLVTKSEVTTDCGLNCLPLVKFTNTVCAVPTGERWLDTRYPYDALQGDAIAEDSPDLPLSGFPPFPSRGGPKPIDHITYDDQFTMYLMWRSSKPLSIPVPLGWVKWGWQGTAYQDSGANPPKWTCPGFPGLRSAGICTSESSHFPSDGDGFNKATGGKSDFPEWSRVESPNIQFGPCR